MREFFVLSRMVGRTWKGVLTPGYFEPCNFLLLTMPKPLTVWITINCRNFPPSGPSAGISRAFYLLLFSR